MCTALEQKYFITFEKGAQGRTESFSEAIRQKWISVVFPLVNQGKSGVDWRDAHSAQRCFSIPLVCRVSATSPHWALERKAAAAAVFFLSSPFCSSARSTRTFSLWWNAWFSLTFALQEQWCRNLGDNKGIPWLSAQMHWLISKTDKQKPQEVHATLIDLRS